MTSRKSYRPLRVLTVLPTIIIALFFLLGGSALLVYEVSHPPTHTTHVFLFAGLAVLGALMLPAIGAVLASAAKRGLEVVGPYLPPYLPVPGGRRASDPPVAVPAAPLAPLPPTIPDRTSIPAPEKGP